MLTKLYFCLFCPQKFETNDENLLKKHIINSHFDGSDQKILKCWIKSVATYQTELNECLSADPKSLPKSSMCQSAANVRQKLLKGCGFCDKIIDTFKLGVISGKKPKNTCVCGGSKEDNKVVVYCQKCKHLFHYNCVEPTAYSGEEISLYVCIRCKDKDFEISELSSESRISQPIHVKHHYNYLQFVCNLCKESHFSESFLKTHLKSEHNLTPNESQISEYFSLNSISKVERLVDQSLDKIIARTPVSTGQTTQSTSNQKIIDGSSDLSKNKRFPTNEDKDSVAKRGDSERITKRLTFESNCATVIQNSALNPNRNSMATHNRPQKLTTQIIRVDPPVLINQTLVDISYNRKSVSPQKGQKRKRGRPKISSNQSKSFHQFNDSVRKIITPNSYVDSNPQKKSRLSEKSRLSRPNIRLSREQENALKNSRNESNSNKTNCDTNVSDDSDWDERTELYETIRPFAQNTPTNNKGQTGSKGTTAQNNRGKQSDDNTSDENQSVNQIDSESEIEVLANQSNNDLRAHSSKQRPQSEDSEKEIDETGLQIRSNSTSDFSVQNEEPNAIRSNLSDWLTQTKPKKFPYFPQINDEVVYIPYGHRTYINTVRSLGLYRQTNTNKYVTHHLNDIVYAKVKSIDFIKYSNVRLIKLVLNLVEDEVETNKSFTVKFHDIDNVIDFIVLKQMFDNSILRNWKVGQSFRAVVEDKWWFGTIQSYNAEEYNMKSHFQSLNIVWGNGSADYLSFWDLEPIIGPLPQNRRSSFEVTDADRKQFYISEVKEWPPIGKEKECLRIVKGLTQIMALSESKQLIETFKLSNNDFVEKVPYLLSLDLIRNRVKNMFYRRHSAIKYDIKFLESNALILDRNDKTGLIRNTRIVVKLCLKFIDEHNATDIQHIHKKLISDLEKDPNILLDIKYHSCVRRDLNNSPNIPNPLVVDSMSQIMGTNATQRHMNLLTPSTSSPRVNKIRLSDEEDIPIIELSDSDEDSVEESSDRVQHTDQKVNRVGGSSVVPGSPTPLSSTRRSPPKIMSKPIVTVRAMPIEEPPPTIINKSISNQFHCYFCIFCNRKLSDKREATDHYFKELKVDLKCVHCPQKQSFESVVNFLEHNSEHIRKMNISLQNNSFKNRELWIKSMVEFMDSLTNQMTVQNKIDQKFGDRCNVCKCLNVSTPDSQPFFHKTVFQNNRSLNPFSKSEFVQHLKRHLRYEPVFNCEICANESSDVFVSVGLDENCQKHIENVHKVKTRSLSDVQPFFWSTQIQEIEDLIKQSMNYFIINCSNC